MKFVSFLLVAALVQAGDWTRFRGPNGTGIGDGSGFPVEFSKEKNLAWRIALPPGYSSPILRGNRIYVTAAEDQKLYIIALDATTGKEIWRTLAFELPNKWKTVNTPVSSTPAVDADGVYILLNDFGLIAYTLDGAEKWRLKLAPFNTPYGMGTSPIVEDSKVLLQADLDTNSYFLAVSTKDGKMVWKTPRPESTHGFSTPVIYRPKKGEPQAVLSGSYQVAGYSLKTGERLWWIGGMAWQAKSLPVINGDTMYVHSWMASIAELGSSGDIPPFSEMIANYDADKSGKLSKTEVPDKTLAALWFLFDLDKDGELNEREWGIHKARNSSGNGLFAIQLGGKGDLTEKAVLWKYEKSLPNIPSPILYNGVVFLLKEGGILTSFDAKTGKVLKQGRVQGALDPYFASPVAADGKVYVATNTGKIGVLKATGDWQILAVNELDEDTWATPILSGGKIYLRTQAAPYCFETKEVKG